ncbi:MAG TPA: diacylglycerol kinase family protein [Bdellovibrionales bacterium]|nr:diacylglycerol kinase family protein [Bdellovibrionales bacterium]
MRTCFILNPHSGRGRREARLSRTRRYFEKKLGQFHLIITKNRDDVTAQTRQALVEGFDQIVILGGDGTINAAVNGFFNENGPVNPNACLVVTKWGTGSDYYKTVTAGSFVSDWKTLVTEHRLRDVDLGELEFKDGRKLFVNIASVGISAVVAEMKNRGPQWVPNALSYLVPAISALIKYKVTPAKITYDSQTRQARMLALFAAKGIFAGGGMKFGGGVDVDDGFFDVKLFEDMGVLKGLRRIPRLYQGAYSGIEEIHAFRAREIRVESPIPLAVECDGEVYGHTDVIIRIRPKAIKFCWPRE